MTNRIKISLKCAARQSETSSGWIGECPEMGIVVYSETLDGLFSEFDETLTLLITDLIEEGDLQEFLVSKGWIKSGPKVKQSPKSVIGQFMNNPVPWELVARHGVANYGQT